MAYVSVTTSLECLVTGGGKVSGKFNFGVVKWGGGDESIRYGRLEAAQYLFRPFTYFPSEISLGGGISAKGDNCSIVKTPIIIPAEGMDTCSMLQIWFL